MLHNLMKTGILLKQVFNRFNYSKSFHTTSVFEKMKVVPIEALSDNYMYLIIDEASNECAAIDPVEPKKLLDKVKELKVNLTKVLTTHHHWDHADGNPELIKSLSAPIPVYGGDDRIPAMTKKIGQDDTFKIGTLDVKCLFTPCHTTGHICYYITSTVDNVAPIVFTGDTLFIAGCGRFFEGNATQMYDALINKLSKLPGNTKVYCGHEYTTASLKFALHVEPENEQTSAKLVWSEKQRSENVPTIPSTIKEEMDFNPFMRVDLKHFQDRYQSTDPILVMERLRKEKDTFKAK